jgi:hypothetical protein
VDERGDLNTLMADGDDFKHPYGKRPAAVCKDARTCARCKQRGPWSLLLQSSKIRFLSITSELLRRSAIMRIFCIAVVVSVIIAVVSGFSLTMIQKPVSVAFSAQGVRL